MQRVVMLHQSREQQRAAVEASVRSLERMMQLKKRNAVAQKELEKNATRGCRREEQAGCDRSGSVVCFGTAVHHAQRRSAPEHHGTGFPRRPRPTERALSRGASGPTHSRLVEEP